MTTRTDLIDSIHTALHSYTGVHERVTWLTTAISSSALSLRPADPSQLSRGVAEIDDELVYINATDSTSAALAPFGRGYRSSTAASHAINAQVTMDPSFPRVEISKAIDNVIEALYPALFQVKQTTLDAQVVDTSYTLPADCQRVLRVDIKLAGDPSDYWHPLVDYEESEDTPHVLSSYQGAPPGATIRVTYAAKFLPLTTSFAASGIPESYNDLITYAVTSRMIRFLEPARLQLGSVENVSRAQLIQSGDAGRTATQLYALYQQRVAEERRRLLESYPARPNFNSR